jgi:SnoaL-like domain
VDVTPQMQKALQEIVDHHEIRKLLSVYCHGCDRGDQHRMAGVYLEEAWDDHGTYKGSGKGFAKQVMSNLASQRQKLVHLLGQSLIDVNGDEAGAETYFLASNVKADKDGHDVVHLLSGRYVDTLRRENGQWKIAKRICVREWSMSIDKEEDWLEHSNFVDSRMSGEDPSYAVLGLTHPGLPVRS